MAIDLNTLSRAELQQLQLDIQVALVDLEKKEREEALQAAELAVAKFGFSLADITDTGDKKRKTKRAQNAGVPKYANPNDATQTWTGKGRQPQWFKDAMDAGIDQGSMEI